MDLGAGVGRQQALAMVGAKCSAAQAQSLKTIKETRWFEKLRMNWDQFCTEYVGISRTQVDKYIAQYKEFGENYFRLAELARISPDLYRHIEGQVTETTIELHGDIIPLTSENAPRIRAGIARLRQQLQDARCKPATPTLAGIQWEADGFVAGFRRFAAMIKPGYEPAIKATLRRTIQRLMDIDHQIKWS
jgi:hypothetical protein